jgi:hypothetical protein
MPASEIDVRDLLASLWRQKLVLLIALAVNLLIAILYLNLATYRYAVTLIVTPVQSTSASLSGKIGGLAGLAGISLPSDTSADAFKLYMEGLKSRPVADTLAKDQQLMTSFFPDEWSADEKKWHEPSSLGHFFTTAIRWALGLPVRAWQPPDGGRLQELLEDDVNVVETRDQPAVSVTFSTSDPQFGVVVLERLHRTVDGMIKKRVLARASDSIDYLQKKLQRETVADYRQALIDQEAQQEQLRMMASASVSYAADPFGPPTASRFPVSPRPMYVLVFAIVFGLVVGVPVALARDRWERNRRANV